MKTTKKLFALLMAAMMLFATTSVVMAETTEAETITVVVSDDTYIHRGYGGNSYNTEAMLWSVNIADTGTQWRREILLRWDLSSYVPDGKEIATAVMKIRQDKAQTVSKINVYGISNTTYPENATYNTFGTSPALSGTLAGEFYSTAAAEWVSVDLSTYFNSISTDKGVHAFSIIGDVAETTFSIYSKEQTTGWAAPVLEITLKDTETSEPDEPSDASVTITASEDTYVNKLDASNNFSTATELMTNNVSTDYFREAYVKFNLSSIVIPEGYEIDTAKVTVNVSSAYSKATSIEISDISADTDFTTLTANNIPVKGSAVGSAAITAGTIGSYDVDISDYIKSLSNLNSYVAFAINGNYNGSLYLTSLEGDADLAPRLTITFIEAPEKTEDKVNVNEIAAFSLYNASLKDDTKDPGDVIYTPYANADGIYTLSYAINDNEKRYVMMSFDLSGITVPEGKVIKSATLKTYFKNNYSEQPVVIEAIGVSDTDFTAATATWNNQPDMDRNYIGNGTVTGSATSNVVNDWTSIDITPYFTSCYYGNETAIACALQMSGIYKKANGGYGSITMKAYEENAETNPMIELVYAEADETLSFGEMLFYQNCYNNPVQELASGRVIVEIPVNYAGNNVKSYNVFLAAYDTQTKMLLFADRKTVSFAGTNGQSVTAVFDTPDFDTTYTWRAFMWNDNLLPIIPDGGITGPQE